MTPSQRRRGGILAIITAALFGTACTPTQAPAAAPEAVTVAYVIDGDTLQVTDPAGAEQRVRILGIDAPEIAHHDQAGECGGQEAAERLRALLPEGTTVQLHTDSRADDEDRYGRLLRYVYLTDGTDVGATLITEGYAYAYTPTSEPDPDRAKSYQDATTTARATGVGSWSTCPDLDH